ncbi:CBS domain-containing protein [Methylobacterium sp. BTF04]|nr:CBS domain-containing protein [Methylobacterium sp. BTF04]
MGASQKIGSDASRVQYIRMNRPVRDAVRLLSRPDVDALVIIDGDREADGIIIGIVTERDVFRAMADGGLEVLDGLVWMLAKNDFISMDVSQSPESRLKQFCTHKTDHIAIMDGFALKSVQSIWDCVTDVPMGRSVV